MRRRRGERETEGVRRDVEDGKVGEMGDGVVQCGCWFVVLLLRPLDRKRTEPGREPGRVRETERGQGTRRAS
jgi:hypothetical protein